MTPTQKILVGALVTTAVAWWMYGPMKFGEKCAVGASSIATPVGNAVAEAPATAEAVAGCQTKVDGVINGKTINFTSGGSVITPESLTLVEALATELKACEGTSVEVAGHTDVTGGSAQNQALSENRANAVVAALVERGVPVARLLPKGLGETAPLDPAVTSAANAKNRRIEFKVATSAAAPSAGQ